MDKTNPANIYLFKVNNRNTRKMYEIFSELTIKQQNDVNEVVLVFLLLTLNIFHTFSKCFYCWFWTSKCYQGKLCSRLSYFHKLNTKTMSSDLAVKSFLLAKSKSLILFLYHPLWVILEHGCNIIIISPSRYLLV